MKNIVILALVFFCLNSQTGNAQNKVVLTNSEHTATITVKDSTKYSARYLQNLLKSMDHLKGISTNVTSFKIEDSLITVEGEGGGVGTFPNYLPLNKRKAFVGNRDDTSYVLTVERINYTTVKYHVKVTYVNLQILDQEGQADLKPWFFLGSPTGWDEDAKTGYEFTDYEDDRGASFFGIGVGISQGRLKASFWRYTENYEKVIASSVMNEKQPK
jgi:hypothetical protein